VEKMLQPEIDAAAREILGYLDSYGDAPVIAVKEALGKPELHFYMGLGELVLRHLVAIREREGICWTVRAPELAKAA
jgi:hypothetical protein